MALIVEDGTGKPDAESYCDLATIAAYATARGLVFVITGGSNEADAEAAARRATVWVDARYRARFTGRRTHGRKQALEWPRVDAHDQQCPPDYLESDEVPQEIIDACCEAAIREKAAPGALSPDVTPGTVAKRERVEGAVEVEYFRAGGVSDQRPVATVIDDILGSLLGGRGNGLFGKAVRS